jgi:hypothetical protein
LGANKIDIIVPAGMVLSINIVGSARAICPAVASPAKKATAPPIILLLRFTSSLFADKMVANLGEACGANASAPALIVANNAITFMFHSYGCPVTDVEIDQCTEGSLKLSVR